MDRKHGKYVVNVEPSGKQLPRTCTNGQEAQQHACWCPSSNDRTANVSSNLSGVWVSPGILAHSECQYPEPCNTQMAGNGCGDKSLWKAFLASLLASVITTAIGVLILSLVNRNNSPIVIQVSSNTEASTLAPRTTSITSQTTGSTTTSTSSETVATTATVTSTEPARTSALTQTSPSTAPTGTSTTTTMTMTSTQPVTTTTNTATSSVPTSTTASTQPTTSAATVSSTQPATTSAAASSGTTPAAVLPKLWSLNNLAMNRS
ncbi:dynactin-associated protein-like [Meriones unguiculatus]|uniref:dynactin-associated protein-like n=1 Tax=Meriones unguiculatus TaxID=10047 RepID=UPI00293F3877|nr:dynactin-associated protein-like [Meriones unguiculatus]